MTSPLAKNSVITPPLQKKYFLETTKEGFPINYQLAFTHEEYFGNGNESYEPIGTNSITVASPLAGPLTIDFRTNAQNYYNRCMYIIVPGFVTQNVEILFKNLPYSVLELNTPNIINNYVIAPTLNHKIYWVGIGEQGASILQF